MLGIFVHPLDVQNEGIQQVFDNLEAVGTKARMVSVIRDSRVNGMWVQMYGYLSDRMLEILRQVWR